MLLIVQDINSLDALIRIMALTSFLCFYSLVALTIWSFMPSDVKCARALRGLSEL